MPEQSILSVKDLEVFYGGIQALHGVCLEVGKGEILSIIGANGAPEDDCRRPADREGLDPV